jgi:predicted dehydrogenase
MDIVRFGIIGVGGMGTAHAHNMSRIPEAELTAVCDVAPGALKAATEAFEVPGFAKHTELLDSGLVDAVLVATPHYFHPPIAIDAMRRNIHVISEKPMAVAVSNADAMIKTAEETGVVFAVMFQQRMLPVYHIFTWLGGGASRVTARVATRQHRIEVEDEAAAMLEYPNGAIGYLLETVNEAPTGSRIELCGEYGKLVLDREGIHFWKIKPGVCTFSDASTAMWAGPEVVETEVPLEERETGHAAIVRNVARAILYGEALISPGAEALPSLELADAILLSGHRGKPVDMPLDRAEYDAFLAEMRATSQEKSVEDKRITDPQHAH